MFHRLPTLVERPRFYLTNASDFGAHKFVFTNMVTGKNFTRTAEDGWTAQIAWEFNNIFARGTIYENLP